MILAAVAATAISLGVILPDTGIDGGEGLRLRDAVALAAADERARGGYIALWGLEHRTGVRNPHQDEGSDNGADVAVAPALVQTIAKTGARVVIGPLRSNVAVAMLPALERSRIVAITSTAFSPDPLHPHLFRLAPSQRQRATLADATIRQQFGAHICVLDDGTPTGRRRGEALTAVDPAAHHLSILSLAPNPFVNACVARADAVYLAGEGAQPIFASRATVRQAGAARLVAALSRRDFAIEPFTGAGTFFRVEDVPLVRTKAGEDVARRYHARNHVFADDAVLRTYAATQIAVQATRLAKRGDTAGALRTHTFSTILGEVRFNERGDPLQPNMVVKALTPPLSSRAANAVSVVEGQR